MSKAISQKDFIPKDFYPIIKSAPLTLQERGNATSFSYSERHLKCVWFDKSLRPAKLKTNEGDTIVVEHPGRWNLEAGPDFLDAALQILPAHHDPVGSYNRPETPSFRISGDIEIHISANDWLKHHHSKNPAYNRVKAHITYHPGYLPSGVLPDGALQISIKESLAAMPLFSFEAIDIAAYPFSTPEPITPCSLIAANIGPDNTGTLLDAAGATRLRKKSERIASSISEKGINQALYEEIMAALGYRKNNAQFRCLAGRLPLALLREESRLNPIAAHALLMGTAGLLPSQTEPNWDIETRDFIRELWNYWWKYQGRWQSSVMDKNTWNTAGTRPQNHPRRRLMAAALLFCKKEELADQLINTPSEQPAKWMKKISAILQPGSIPSCYWECRLGFSGSKNSKPISLIGKRRAAAMISNAVIPFIAANDPNAISMDLLQTLAPEEDNGIIRQTAHSILGQDHNPLLYKNGLRQQGLIQIFHDYCLNDRSGCKECFFPDTLKNIRPEKK